MIRRHCGDGFSRTSHPAPLDGCTRGGDRIDLKTIGFFSLVGQAYVFKFLWSPLMDRYTPPFFGRRRGWLLATQIRLLVAIAAMGFLEPGTQLRWMAALAVVIAFCSASQDLVFDAWKTDVLPAEERGAGAAISVLGYRLGMLVSGGLALWLADKWLGAPGRRTWCGRGNQRAGLPFRDAGFRRLSPVAGR